MTTSIVHHLNGFWSLFTFKFTCMLELDTVYSPDQLMCLEIHMLPASGSLTFWFLDTGRTPVYSLLMDTLRGLPVIRAMKKQKYFTQQFHEYQDKHTSAWFLFFSAFRWLGVRAEWLLSFFMAVCMIVVISAPSVIGRNTLVWKRVFTNETVYYL